MRLLSLLSKKLGGIQVIVWICAVFSLLSLYHFFSHKLYYTGSDIFYYMGLAENFIKTGKMQDITSTPFRTVSSPQLGIVFVFSFLQLIHLTPDTIIKVVSAFYYFIYVLSFYPILKITQILNFTKVQTQLLAIAYYSHWIIYRLQMIPINDGISNIIAFWLIYFIASHLNSGRKHLIPVFILSILGPYFRISSLAILAMAIITSIFLKKWKILLWYLFLFTISLALFRVFLSSRIFNSQNQTVINISTNVTYFNNKIGIKVSEPSLIIKDAKKLFLERIPRLYLMDFKSRLSLLNWGYILFVIPPFLYVFKGIKKRQPVTLFLSGIILVTYAFVFYTSIISHRYFLFTYILSVALFIKFFYHSSLGRLFVIGYISLLPIFSIYTLLVKNSDYCLPSILKQLKASNVALESNAILFSSLPRHTYFFLNHPSSSTPLVEENLELPVYVVDNDNQIKDLADQYAQRTGQKIKFIPQLRLNHSINSCSFGKFSKI